MDRCCLGYDTWVPPETLPPPFNGCPHIRNAINLSTLERKMTGVSTWRTRLLGLPMDQLELRPPHVILLKFMRHLPPGTWQWQEGQIPFHRSLQKRSQSHQFQQYKNTRDMKRIYANESSRWTQYSSPLMATLTRIKRSSTRHIKGTYMIGWHTPITWQKGPLQPPAGMPLRVNSAVT